MVKYYKNMTCFEKKWKNMAESRSNNFTKCLEVPSYIRRYKCLIKRQMTLFI